MKAANLARIARGRILSGSPDMEIDPAKISTDSRAPFRRGGFFIALKGANFDGNRFVNDAFEKGAIGALVAQPPAPPAARRGKLIIQTDDTTRSLRDIASAHRKKFKIPVIAVTGSNGKTTVKDMIWSVLSKKYNVLRNEGTRNNHIGVSQTLLKLKASHAACVIELGTNHKGEIGCLAGISRPDIAVITNIGPSHLEFLRDLEGVYEAKKEILEFMDREKGILIVNGDDVFLSRMKDGVSRIIRFGMKDANDFSARIVSTGRGRIRFRVNDEMLFELKLLGAHNVYNALAAIAVAFQSGLSYRSISKGLAAYRPTAMRLNLERVRGVDIINDSYNSNPLSMERALDTVKNYPAHARWVVSGDMLELGPGSARLHRDMGCSIARSGIEGVLTFGNLSRHVLSGALACGVRPERLWRCSSHEEIARILKKITKKGDVVLLKGSRGMKMEEVLTKLKTQNAKRKT